MSVMLKLLKSDEEKRDSRRLEQEVNLFVEKEIIKMCYFLKETVTFKMVVDYLLLQNTYQGSVEQPSSKRIFPTLSSSINKNCTMYSI